MSNRYNGLLVSQMGEPLDAEKNAALYARIIAGDPAAREEMITGNMALVISKVDSFLRNVPQMAYLRDDLTSAGFIGLTQAVNALADGTRVRNPGYVPCYLGQRISTELTRLVDEDEAPIRVPHTSEHRARTNGQKVTPPTVQNAIPERFEVSSYEKELEMRDLIDSCCTCDEERTFVAMREAGHTYAEVAKAIDMPLTSTYVMAKELDARVQGKLAALLNE